MSVPADSGLGGRASIPGMTPPHALDALFAAAADGPDVEIPPGWGQGRATFGGLVTGVLLARFHAAYGIDPGTLRAATTSFVAPVTTGPARVEAILLRRGSSATQAEIRLWQRDDRTGEDTVRAVLLASYGADRASTIEVAPTRPSGPLPDPESLPAIPHLPGVTPDFFGHVELRVATGAFPFSGAHGGDLTGWMRFRDTPVHFSLAHFVALVDAWPPAPGQMLTRPVGMSSLTWTIELIGPVADDPAAPWWYEVTTDAAHDGYAHSHARIFAADGTPVAISRQTITIFG